MSAQTICQMKSTRIYDTQTLHYIVLRVHIILFLRICRNNQVALQLQLQINWAMFSHWWWPRLLYLCYTMYTSWLRKKRRLIKSISWMKLIWFIRTHAHAYTQKFKISNQSYRDRHVWSLTGKHIFASEIRKQNAGLERMNWWQISH